MGTVPGKNRNPRTGIDEYIIKYLIGLGVDEVSHVCGFRRVHQHRAIRTDTHAFGFNADRHFINQIPFLHVGDCNHVVVFVGDIERIASGVKDEQLWIGARRKSFCDLQGFQVEHLDVFGIASTNVEFALVMAKNDAAGPLAHRHCRYDFVGAAVDDADGIVLFIGYVNSDCIGLRC